MDNDSPARTGEPLALQSNDLLGLVEPAGFRTRYRSEPGMIGHYPWTYADQRRRRADRPEHETEDLYTADQVRAMLAAERERWIAKAGATYTDAHAIFNDPPSETPQVVRDVIEWHLHAMRANEEA